MKFLFAFSFFLSFSVPALVIASCPSQVFISVLCQPNQKDLQLVKHLGKYTQPREEVDDSQDIIICSYGSDEWVSKYRYLENDQEKIVSASNLEDLADIAQLLAARGFRVEHFGGNSNPFSMLTYKNGNQQKADQVFLFSGLESTFENNNFIVNATDVKNASTVSTVVINERYLKTLDTAADTFETGSDCQIAIK